MLQYELLPQDQPSVEEKKQGEKKAAPTKPVGPRDLDSIKSPRRTSVSRESILVIIKTVQLSS